MQQEKATGHTITNNIMFELPFIRNLQFTKSSKKTREREREREGERKGEREREKEKETVPQNVRHSVCLA